MILAERFIILCFLTQVSIGLSYAGREDQDNTITKPPDYEINSEENKIEDGPLFFKINTKRNKPYKPFTLPILEIPNIDGFDQKSAWEVYNNEKTSNEKENDKNFEQKDREGKLLKADDVIANESTSTMVSDEDITSPESTSRPSTLGEILVKPIHRSTYIYFYKPIDSSKTSVTSSTVEENGDQDYFGTKHNAFSSLGLGYPFLDNIFSIPGANIRNQASPKNHHTHHVQDQDKSHNNGFSSSGFGYPFVNNFHSFLDETPIKRAVTKVKIFSENFEEEHPTEQEETDRSNEDGKEDESIKIDEVKDDNVQENKREDKKIENESTLKKSEAHQQTANVEEILSSIMPIYDWATSSLLNMNMNQDILNIGRILRNGYYNSLTKVTNKKEERPEPHQPKPDILPDVEKYDNSEPHSFIEELIDEMNADSESNKELNIERPPTDRDLPDIGSEDSKNIKPRSPAKCICGFSQGSTNSCSCFPETLVYYQYCSVPLPPTD